MFSYTTTTLTGTCSCESGRCIRTAVLAARRETCLKVIECKVGSQKLNLITKTKAKVPKRIIGCKIYVMLSDVRLLGVARSIRTGFRITASVDTRYLYLQTTLSLHARHFHSYVPHINMCHFWMSCKHRNCRRNCSEAMMMSAKLHEYATPKLLRKTKKNFARILKHDS